jgi:GNAT superfamily N-acetyltransferase
MAHAAAFAQAAGIATRPRADGDEALLRALFATSRAAELAALPVELAGPFLDLQLALREGSLPATAQDDVVEVGGQPVGRWVVDRSQPALRLVDVALLPPHQRRGIGSALLAGLCEEADAAGRPVDLHVRCGSPAARLYARFGFRTLGGDGVHDAMRRPPAPFPTAPAPTESTRTAAIAYDPTVSDPTASDPQRPTPQEAAGERPVPR